jgi:hypothetical protein
MTGCQKAINLEVYKVIEGLGGEPELLAIIGSYGDKLADEEMLQDWNAGRRTFRSGSIEHGRPTPSRAEWL